MTVFCDVLQKCEDNKCVEISDKFRSIPRIPMWKQLGDDIIGEAAYDGFGYSICLSKSGNTLVVGGPDNKGNGIINSGHVRVYTMFRNVWTQLGDDFNGVAEYDQLGRSVALSDDGSVLIMGAPGNGNTSGHVRVYKWSDEVWTQKGNTIIGEASYDQSGSSVTMNRSGSVIAIASDENGGNGIFSGHVRVFEFNDGSSSWVRKGLPIGGENAHDQLGHSISLDSIGSTIAIGAPYNDGNSNASGYVRVYD